MFADHHGIDDEFYAADGLGHRFDDRRRAQRSGLGGMGRYVIENGFDLLTDQFRIEEFDTADGLCILDGDQRQYRLAVDAELVKSFEIGLDAGAAAGIRAGDG